MTEEKQSVEEIKAMIQSLKDLKASFEPVKEKALEQQIYFKGYATGAAQLLEIMETRIKNFEYQVETLKAPPAEEEAEQEEKTLPENWVNTVQE
jgi:hypothetical protein